MSKTPRFVFAALLAAAALTSSLASATDRGPCDHCAKEPPAAEGERPTKEEDKSQEPIQDVEVEQRKPESGYSPQFYFPTVKTTGK
ncbi:hypothetical protein [Pelagibius sp.]|uniref:hypothetical protein n=1 Tax=Pelagibius sp. TaxID=1931238 RepID=UPI0026182415|nr:hypothetical protein [Pelagibius sp.]